MEHRESIRVRFGEVDAMDVVWHGHYAAYFETGREGFGRRFGLGYTRMRAVGVKAPVVHLSCDYLQPARYGDELEIVVRLHPCPSAKIEMHYELIRSADNTLLTRGQTIQVFVDERGELLLTLPPLMRDFYERWFGELPVRDNHD